MSVDDFKKKFKKFLVEEVKTSPGGVTLTEINEVDVFPEDIQGFLLSLYENEDADYHRIGTLFNSVFSARNPLFMISQSNLHPLVRKDPNTKTRSCDGTMYTRVLRKVLDSKLMIEVEPYVRPKTAGLYSVGTPMIKDMLIREMGKDAYEAVYETHYLWYNKNNSTKAATKDKAKELDPVVEAAYKNARKKYGSGS